MTSASLPATPLRQRMIEDMKIRNLSPHTIQAYVDPGRRVRQAFRKVAAAFGSEGGSVLPCFPRRGEACLIELLGPSDVRPPISLPRDSRQGPGSIGTENRHNGVIAEESLET